MPLATSTGTPIARASSWITPWSAIGVRPHFWLGSLQPAVNGLVEHPQGVLRGELRLPRGSQPRSGIARGVRRHADGVQQQRSVGVRVFPPVRKAERAVGASHRRDSAGRRLRVHAQPGPRHAVAGPARIGHAAIDLWRLLRLSAARDHVARPRGIRATLPDGAGMERKMALQSGPWI